MTNKNIRNIDFKTMIEDSVIYHLTGVEPMITIDLPVFGFFNFEKILCMRAEDKTMLFQGDVIAYQLGYKDIEYALDNYVSEENKTEEEMMPEEPEYGIERIAVTFVNENGLYELILCSEREEAKQFKDWINQIIAIVN